jgi:UDP:flavonoid glycosyltransferase YjiC (YdhE family)
MLAGLPQLVCHSDLEKRINGDAVAKAGLGASCLLPATEAGVLSEALTRMYQNEGLAARARAAAPDFHARYDRTMPQAVADAVDALL